MLFNLISNAYKFTQEGKIEVKATYENDNIIAINVSDTGTGIKNEDIGKLFHDFAKLDDPLKLNPQGVGLGLSICSKISKLLDGDISVHSEYGIGSIFIFKFRNLLLTNDNVMSDNKMEDQKYENIEEVKSMSMIRNDDLKETDFYIESKIKKSCNCASILIVDDDTSQRRPIVNYCKRFQITYDEAENSKVALDKVEAKLNDTCCKVYSLIFIDSNMPILGGVEASLKIREIEDTHHTKHSRIIGLSAKISDFDYVIKDSSKKNIFWKVYTKPLKFSVFQSIISLVLH